MKATVRQVMRSVIRGCAVWMIGALSPSSRPATTTEMTPEACACSAARKAAKEVRNEIAVSISGSVIRLRSQATRANGAKPMEPRHRLPHREVDPDRGEGDTTRQGGDRGTQRHQRGRVVEQRLALEDRHDAPGQADAAGDRGGGDRVRGGDDRADGEGRGPPQAGSSGVHDRPHHQGGHHARRTESRRMEATVGVEVDQRGLHRRRVEQGRRRPEHDLVVQVDGRQGRNRPTPPPRPR